MSVARIARLQARLDMYLAAEQAILEGNQSWSSPDGMNYSRGDLGRIQYEIRSLEAQLEFNSGHAYQGTQITFGRPGR